MHVGDILLQLLPYPSGQVAGPQVSWDMTVYSLTDMPVEKSGKIAMGQSILFIVLVS